MRSLAARGSSKRRARDAVLGRGESCGAGWVDWGGGLGFNRKRNELGVWGEPLYLLPES